MNNLKIGDKVFIEFRSYTGSMIEIATIKRLTKTLIVIERNNQEWKFKKNNYYRADDYFHSNIGQNNSGGSYAPNDYLYKIDNTEKIEEHILNILTRVETELTDKIHKNLMKYKFNYSELNKISNTIDKLINERKIKINEQLK